MKTVPTNMPVFIDYDVATEVFEVATDAKGLRFEVRRPNGSTVAELPFGLRPEEKALATLFANAPDMLDAIETVLQMHGSQLPHEAERILSQVAHFARYKPE